MELITPRQSSMGSLSFIAPVATQAIEEYYFSAPTSPRQISQFYREFDEFLINTSMRDDGRRNSVSSSVPFDWEVKPGIPKSVSMDMKFEDDFAFDVSQEMETASLSAEELFDGGKIRPLKPPPRSQFPQQHSTETSPMVSPRSHGSKKTNRRTLSPKQKKLNDHFGTGFENRGNKTPERQRGRERSSVSSLSSSRSGHRATRSLSPLRVSEYPWEEEYKQQQQQQHQNSKQSFTSSKESKPPLTSTTSALSSSSLKNYRKWRLKDFFLFRSASEGRATGKDPLKKYASLFKKHDELKSSSFRSIDNAGSSVSNSRRKGISAHELHYTMNRAVSEDLKKKTFLPYKQGILGRLAFNPAVHAIANGFGFSRK